MKKILLILLIAFSTGIFAQKMDGFRDWKWSTPFSEVEQELVKSKNKLPGFKAYDKIGDKLEFEGMKARLITYGFKKNKFRAVNIGMYSRDLDKIIDIFTKKFGKPKKTEMPFLKNWEWHLDLVDISVAYFPSKKDEGITIGIKGKR